jgi:formylglycine-generating enzyme required for sulfatase activity
MSLIFLSHSSANNIEAIALRDWLVEQGWNDLFLDLDPHRGLRAGQRWQGALKQAAERCEIVICLISPSWVTSKWCLAELLLAKQLNKSIFGVIVEPTPPADIPIELTAEWQLVDLTAGTRHHELEVELPEAAGTTVVKYASDGLARLYIGLRQSGVDARYFKWPPENDPDRAPYRGLKPFESEDAGIFFGREGPTVLGLDTLRGLREAAAPRILIILGASGSGKSSFMRAGLLPRLQRMDHHFLPLPVIRPERAVIIGATGLISSLEQALNSGHLSRARSDIREAIEPGGSGIGPLLSALVEAKTRQFGLCESKDNKSPIIVISIDQAEELFAPEGAKEAQTFLVILRDTLWRDPPAAIALFTIRSDSYEPLQSASALDGLRQHTLSLAPMPQGNYVSVIKGPLEFLAGRDRALIIEEPLVQALLTDIENGRAKDALPLLAFTLERLYLEFRGTGRLTFHQYAKLGGISGCIETAAERSLDAADNIPAIPRDHQKRMALLRRGLIPWLVSLDPETGAPRRRVARRSEIPDASRPLIDLMVNQRLLSTDLDKETGETTIEVTHEALLRQWGVLKDWLKEDASQLAVVDGIKRATRMWIDSGRRSAWLTHSGGNLTAAERLRKRDELAQFVDAAEWTYVMECRRRARRKKWWAGFFAFCVVSVAGLAYDGFLSTTYLEGQYNGVLNRIRNASLTPGDVTRDCGGEVCPEMILLPLGEFLMGSPDTENDRVDDEGPQHLVTMSKPLLVSKYEVTFAEWDACHDAGGCSWRPPDQGWGRGRRPVINISWDDTEQYLKWLSAKTGMPYRLLTEEEWEYAARGITDARRPHPAYSWGDDVGSGNANCDGCGGQQAQKRTMPVGSFKPNAFGLYDVQGNVWEWVQDCYDEKRYSTTLMTERFPAPDKGTCTRVVRGGSWRNAPNIIRLAYRNRYMPGLRFNNLGFRVARPLSPAKNSLLVLPR